MMATKRTKPTTIRGDVPFTARLPDGRTLFVLIPAKWCEQDQGGQVLFKPEAARLIDRVQVMAMRTPPQPTPGYVRTLRETLGLTQAELAARVGVDRMTVARWEWGKLRPSRNAAAALDKLRRAVGRRGTAIAA
jgi:DNA-binding transcriptional regulator YiaG